MVWARVTAGAVALVALAACQSQPAAAPVPEAKPLPSAPHVPPAKIDPRDPNIVLVLMDDFSLDLVQTMRNAERMRREGASYPHSYVVDSLCCVSRASIFTGQYPHQTGVLTNTANTPNPVGPIGGWEAFEANGNARRSVNVRLQRHGYTTGFIGKYLNEYAYVAGGELPDAPPGWSEWGVIFGTAYNGWEFESSYVEDGLVHLRQHPAPPASAGDRRKDRAYVGTVTDRMALDFIREHQGDRAPYFLQVAMYGPHSRVGPHPHYPGDPGFPPAFADRAGEGNCGPVPCSSLGLDDLAGYGDRLADNLPRRGDGSEAPAWRTNTPTLTADGARDALRARAQMVQSIDRMLGRILKAVDDNTYVVLTSDNGFHLGQHGLDAGKGTPFDSDVHVPLLVVGPGVAPGERAALTTNLDLASTFEELAGLRPAGYRAGTSLVGSLEDPAVRTRDYVFFEHTYAPSLGADPDKAYAGGTMDLIPSYVAVRSRDALLVRLDLDPSWEGVDHAWEFYDYSEIGWERTNAYADPANARTVARMTRALERFDRCTTFVGDDGLPGRCRGIDREPGPT
jgi:N-acetylglucosamine-6-sulfatase